MVLAATVSAAALPPRWASSCVARAGLPKSRIAMKCSSNSASISAGDGGASRNAGGTGRSFFGSHWIAMIPAFFQEQVSEFRRIEWPSLESTVKTSLFVIVLSFLLIIALTSVDSGYSFILSKFLRV